jgi:hypothetical protein
MSIVQVYKENDSLSRWGEGKGEGRLAGCPHPHPCLLSRRERENDPLSLKKLQELACSLWPPPCNHLSGAKYFSVIHYLAGNLNGDIS